MSTATARPKKLIVEGYQDLYSVAGLMRAHIEWPSGKENPPVWIEQFNGIEEILKTGVIGAKLKERGVQILGVMLDADEKLAARFDRIREQCEEQFPNFPNILPPEGLILINADGQRFGLWIMPDNTSPGCLEVFLKYLVPSESKGLWDHAVKSVDSALEIGAECKSCHVSKANLYTWLAWQDEPGQYPGTALNKEILDPKSQYAAPFVKWFRQLYQL